MRNFKFDNAKALLIILVVVGHMIDYYDDISDEYKILFFFIYLFHMPLFIYISGLFIKSTVNGPRFKYEKIISFFLLYIGLKAATFLIRTYLLGEEDLQFHTFSEDGTPWYLLGMVMWTMLTFIFKNAKPAVVLFISIIAALLIGYDESARDFFAISRVIVFFPFFLLGYYTNIKKISAIANMNKLRILSGLIILLSFIVVCLNIDQLYEYRNYITGRHPYIDNEMENSIDGALYRLAFLAWSAVLSAAILFVTPNKKTIFTKIGERTLQVFCLQRISIYLLHYFNIEGILKSFSSNHWLLLYALLAIPLTLILANKSLEWPFKKVMGLKYSFLFKKES